MNKHITKLGLVLVAGLALGAAVLAQTFPINPAIGVIGQNPGLPNTWTNLVLPGNTTNGATSGPITAGATSNLLSQPFAVVPGYDIGLDITLFGTNSSTSNVTVHVNVTPDNTNWPTVLNLSVVAALNGVTPVHLYTNFPSSFFNSGASVRLEDVVSGDTAGSNAVWIQKVLLLRPKVPVVR